jgi:hypothetical protein
LPSRPAQGGDACRFGIREVIPRLPTFLHDHPELRIDFVMADESKDLVA